MTVHLRKMVMVILVVTFASFAGACGDSGPTAPTPPASPVPHAQSLPVINAFTNEPVNGVTITGVVGTVAGSTVTAEALKGTSLTLNAPSFLPFETSWGVTGRTQFRMFELRFGNTIEKVRQMVFGVNAGSLGNPGPRSLRKARNGATFAVAPTSDLELNELIARSGVVFAARSGHPIRMGNPVAGDVQVNVVFDSTIGALMTTGWDTVDSQGYITGVTIRVKDTSWLTNAWAVAAFVHELYHGFGVSHHEGPGLMGLQWYLVADLLEDELDIVVMVNTLTSGVNEVYNDRAVVSTASTSSTLVMRNMVVCNLAAPPTTTGK
jgi:hypothetical protein